MLQLRLSCRSAIQRRPPRRKLGLTTKRSVSHLASTNVAFAFTGQGSQFPGMAEDLVREFKPAKETVELCEEALKSSLSKTMFRGTPAELRMTEVAQPAIVTHQLAIIRTLQHELGWKVEDKLVGVLGHSVGEIAALTTAGAFSFEDAVRFAQYRGASMQKCVTSDVAMAALLPIDLDNARKAAVEAENLTNKVVDVANINSPKQIVLSGALEAVNKASEIAKAKYGVRKVVELEVSAPFHSRLLQPAEKAIQEYLQTNVAWKNPSIPFVSNYSAQVVSDQPGALEALVKQTCSPVRWVECVQRAHEVLKATHMVEIGPRKILTPLIQQINPAINASFIGSASDLVTFLKSSLAKNP